MQRVVILGAGFGGLELATILSEAVSGDFDVALIDTGVVPLPEFAGRLGQVLTNTVSAATRPMASAASVGLKTRRPPCKACKITWPNPSVTCSNVDTTGPRPSTGPELVVPRLGSGRP